jgi:hypothetical protein
MLATLIGLSLLLALVGGTATLAVCLLAPRLRARQARRHPEQAAVRERPGRARRPAAEWPLLAQTLGLGYRDQWTRQHRFPPAEFTLDDQGVTATVAAIAGAAWPTIRRRPAIWLTPGAASLCGPSNKARPDPAARAAPRPAAHSRSGRSARHGPCLPGVLVVPSARRRPPRAPERTSRLRSLPAGACWQ